MHWQLGSSQGRYDIEPLVVRNTPNPVDRTGFWFDPAQPGYGYSVVTQGDLLMSVAYYYDGNGQPRWGWADNLDGSVPAEGLAVFHFTGTCPGCEPQSPDSQPIGTVSLDIWQESLGQAAINVELPDPVAGEWSTYFRVVTLLSNRPSGRQRDSDMALVTNEDLLRAWFASANGRYPFDNFGIDFSPAPTIEISGTNLQEVGVDENDVVKTDGRFIYALRPQSASRSDQSIAVLEIDPARPELEPIAEIRMDPSGPAVSGMYLALDRPDEQPNLLVVVRGGWGGYLHDFWLTSGPWQGEDAQLLVYDVSSPAEPQLLSEVEFEGTLIETRRIGDRLFTVSRQLPGYSTDQTLADLLPALRINRVASGSLVDTSKVYLPPQAPGYQYGDLVTIAEFDLADPTARPATITYLGLPETVYASPDNIYIASSRWGFGQDPFDRFQPGFVDSEIHQFALAGEQGLRYAGSGEVEGFIGSRGTNPAFALSENSGHLRVVTQGYWEGLGEHRVSVLSLAGDGRQQLELTGFAPNASRPSRLGKPGEDLYGLRFVDKRLYAVTFKKVDPLYVVDLADPADPYIAGELEIPGFSDYLHPVTDDLLLGFGKGAVDASGPGDGNWAWYQGLQLSLFDVSNPASPALVRRFDLGRRGSTSPLLFDHHALAMLPADPDRDRPARIAIPVVIHDAKTQEEISPDPTFFYDYRYTGLTMFSVDPLQRDLRFDDVMITHTAEQNPDRRPWDDGNGQAGRAIISDAHAYFYLLGEMYVSPWADGSIINGPY